MSEAEILAIIMDRFDEIDARFDGIDARFDKMEKETEERFNKMDARFDKMEKETEERFNKMDARFDKIDVRLDKTDEKREDQFNKIDERFDRLENILEEQSIELYNIKKILGNHSDQFVELKSNVKTIHSQAVRLSVNQAKLIEKIDKHIKTDDKSTNENINSI
jgi:chromosome segregation ATPase